MRAPAHTGTGCVRHEVGEAELGVSGGAPGQARGEHGCADVVIVVDLRGGRRYIGLDILAKSRMTLIETARARR